MEQEQHPRMINKRTGQFISRMFFSFSLFAIALVLIASQYVQ